MSFWFLPESPLYESYRDIPKLNSEIGRIASLVCAKYPDMVSVDVGANIGDTAAIIRSACPGPIVCVEGDELVGRVLEENAKRIGNTAVKHVYLSDSREDRYVSISKEGWNSTLLLVDSERDGKKISLVPLDDAIEEIDLRRVKLLKVDTEGFEARVLRGSQNLLKAGRPVVILEYNRENLNSLGEDGLSSFVHLKDHGYRSVLFWDDCDRFLLGTSLSEMGIIEDLHGYVDFRERPCGHFYYLNACVFHDLDQDLAERCLAVEREARDQK